MQASEQHQMIKQLLLTRRQVAQMIGVCERTVYLLTKSGELKSRKIGSRSIRYRPEDVQAFAQREA